MNTMAKVLVIDDEPELRRILVRILTNAGREPLGAEDSQDDVNQFRQQRPLAITDIVMRVEERCETTSELHDEAPRAAIVAMLGDHMLLDIAKILDAEATLSKPVRASDLMRATDE